MSNSDLVKYTKLSPNHSGARTHAIDRITPHCVVGQLSAESICGCFTSTSRQASCNYGIGYDGKVALCVEEKNRSWCSSSNANDQRAVTIEVASGKAEPYEITDAAYNSLIELMADICKRNGKTKLIWFGDKEKSLAYSPAANEMVVTVHRWFANKSCPGTYIYERLGKITESVNKKLGNTSTGSGGTSDSTNSGSEEKKNTSFPDVPFTVKVIVSDLNYRAEPSMSGAVKGQTGKGTFTITQVSNGWGKLKSGAGWIYLENANYVTIGSTAKSSTTTSTAKTETKKSTDEIAKEVLAGKWGNGDDRKNRLTAAGYDYSTVQSRVNELASGTKTETAKKSVDEIAQEVIAGKWGNGTDRKSRITAAGYDYAAVQKRVNELLK